MACGLRIEQKRREDASATGAKTREPGAATGGRGAKTKFARYRETLRTTGRLAGVGPRQREFAAIPSALPINESILSVKRTPSDILALDHMLERSSTKG